MKLSFDCVENGCIINEVPIQGLIGSGSVIFIMEKDKSPDLRIAFWEFF